MAGAAYYLLKSSDAGLIDQHLRYVKKLQSDLESVKGAKSRPGVRGVFQVDLAAKYLDDDGFRALIDKVVASGESFKKKVRHYLFGFSKFTLDGEGWNDIVDDIQEMVFTLETLHLRLGQKDLGFDPYADHKAEAAHEVIKDFTADVYRPVQKLRNLTMDWPNQRRVRDP